MPATEPKSNTVGPMEAHLRRSITEGDTTLVDPRTFLHFASVQDRIRQQLVDALKFCRSVIETNAASVAEMSEDMALEKADAALKAAEETR